MREKPNTFISDSTWEYFNERADNEGYGDHKEDWFAWFEVFEAGYIKGVEDHHDY